jgi:drug/metabolite transporter (DMT)-like permease
VGVRAAVASAVLFGAGTPLAKVLLAGVSPWVLAGLLYLGSGLGLGLYRLISRTPRVHLDAAARLPLVGAVLFGGVVGPVLLMVGLVRLPASGASLLLNAEAVFTVGLAWAVFGEHLGRRIVLGMAAIVAGAVALSVPAGVELGGVWPSLAVLGACLCWAIDNNLTRKVALADATWLAAVKGLVAGPVNLALGVVVAAVGAGSGAGSEAAGTAGALPQPQTVVLALLVGLASYGVSLALFVVALRHLGTARAGAYFSVAPFVGAAVAVAMGEPVTIPLVVAGVLMAVGVWLHLTERHEHTHEHPAITHGHSHVHDDGHHANGRAHGHEAEVPGGVRHAHTHTHEALTHSHEHYPDALHRHPH